jgi:hypothetical protein
MTKATLLLCATLLSGLVARTASAAVCVELDPTRDNLTEQERGATVTLFAQALADQGQQVAQQGCMGVYRIYHVRLGASVTVFVQGPQGYRQATSRTLEELPAVYSQVIRSLITGQPMNTANGTVDRNNVTSTQQAPNRVQSDNLWYVRLGYAGAAGPIPNAGPAFGFGYRYELDSIGIDVSFLNLMLGNSRDSSSTNSGSAAFTASWVKLMALYFMNPSANGSLYFGGGLSWGGTLVTDSTATYSGSGLQVEAAAGYEMLRASTIRLFVQADATLPLYAISQDTTLTTTGTGKGYAPTFTVAFGLGWGRSVVRIHAVP